VKIVSKRARRKRAQIFQKHFIFNENTKILDLGTERCENITMVLSGLSIKPENVYVADIDLEFVESGQLPFADEYFDIVYCSSVIEHVTIPKEQIWKVYSGRRFHTESYARQKEFSKEIKRLGKNYFVQTPNIHFPLESHSLLPFASWLPRRLLLSTLRLTNKFWIKQSDPDWHLLDKKKMHELFNEATIVEEKLLGITKSIMAIYKKQ
jgi:hypothetical protein